MGIWLKKLLAQPLQEAALTSIRNHCDVIDNSTCCLNLNNILSSITQYMNAHAVIPSCASWHVYKHLHHSKTGVKVSNPDFLHEIDQQF
jgi:hypothetical protein